MPRDDNNPELLWTTIRAPKQSDPSHGNGYSNGNGHHPESRNGAVLSTDAVLVRAIHRALAEDEAGTLVDASRPREALRALIAATPAPAIRQPVRRSFWPTAGRRQIALVVALLLITAAAIAYMAYTASVGSCPPGEGPVPPTALKLPASAIVQAVPCDLGPAGQAVPAARPRTGKPPRPSL
jgi:hypothetical protein